MVSLHWKVNIASLASGCIGFLCIYWLKYSNGKVHVTDHFKGLHAQWGLATVIMAISAACFGLILKFNPGLIGLSLSSARRLFLGHRIFGYVISVSVSMTLYFAIQHELKKSRLSWSLAIFSTIVLFITQLLLLSRINFFNSKTK